MSCCGSKRAQLRQATQVSQVLEPGKRTSLQHQPERHSPVYFRYIGKTRLTVMGPETHIRYRFRSPRAVVAVDPRDQRALAAVPTLRQVRKPTDVVKEF